MYDRFPTLCVCAQLIEVAGLNNRDNLVFDALWNYIIAMNLVLLLSYKFGITNVVE